MSDFEGQVGATPYVPEALPLEANSLAEAYRYAYSQVIESRYKLEEIGTGTTEMLMRMMDWANDQSAAKTGHDRRAQAQLSELFSSCDVLFADLTDRLLIPEGDEEFKTSWAKFNQKLAQDYAVAIVMQDEGMLQGYELLRAFAEKIPKNKPATELLSRLEGAKVQGALMNFFQEQGCLVLAPDPEDDQEVFDYDVTNAVDMVVIQPDGKVIFVDVKTNGSEGGSDIFRERGSMWVFREKIPGAMREYQATNPNSKYGGHVQAYLLKENDPSTRPDHVIISVSPNKIDSNGKIDEETQQDLIERYIANEII